LWRQYIPIIFSMVFFSNFFSDFIFPKGTHRGQTDTIDMSPLHYKQFSVISYNFKNI
jgi:hypothetical protein